QLARATRQAQPSMAPMLNLADLVERVSAQPRASPQSLARAFQGFRRQLREANAQIARRFAARLRRRSVVLTYSYSSTVLAAVLAARRKITRVICSEGRPQLEGRRLAAKLARKGIPVVLVADAALPSRVREADVVVMGADAVFPPAYANKIGTEVLQRAALAARKPFYVLADTSKILSARLARFYRIEKKPAAELWQGAPRRVRVVNRYFERIPFARGVMLLTERGPLRR
ncbi:MAG: hypothetical protein HY653_03150, partial [Acidobacteria bacterium]|nr:hypothetical protein [Acidobacteriota bacterium]